MNSCSKSDSVFRYMMGELNDKDRTAFEEHLTACPTCSHELRVERAVQNQLVRSTLSERVPAGLKSNVLEKIHLLKRPRFPYWQIAITLLSGIAAFLLLQHILERSDLLVRGWGILADLSEWISVTSISSGSYPLLIAMGSLIAGISAGISLRIQDKF